MDITDIPMLTARRISEEKRARASAAKRAGSLLCFAFMLISAAAHIFIGASLYLNCEREDLEQAMLFSVLPRRVSQREECTSLQEETTVPPKEETVWDETEKAEPVPHQAESFYLKNETTYNPDLSILFNSPNPISKAPKLYERYGDGAPLVLIYHSHATESYSDTNDSGYYRSCDISKNTVAVGDVIHRCLSANGIGSIHLTEMFDRESYSLAYDKASAAVEKTLKETPSIQYILDVHRDSITDVSGKELSVDFTYGGIAAAQLMFVVERTRGAAVTPTGGEISQRFSI